MITDLFQNLPRNRFTKGSKGLIQRTAMGLLILSLLLIQGCATANAGISLSNIPLDGKKYTVIGPAETTEYWITLDAGVVGIPLSRPPVDRAMQKLLQEKNGDALVNLRYWTDRTVLLFITINRFHLKADVVQLNDQKR